MAITWEEPGKVFWRLVFHRYIEKMDDLPTIAGIARAAGLSEHTLRKQVKESRLPSFQAAQVIGKALGISEDELLPFYRIRSSGSDIPGKRGRQSPRAA